MIRKTETAKDYKTLDNKAIKWAICDNLQAFVNYLNHNLPVDKISRQKAIKIAYTLNNLMKDLEG